MQNLWACFWRDDQCSSHPNISYPNYNSFKIINCTIVSLIESWGNNWTCTIGKQINLIIIPKKISLFLTVIILKLKFIENAVISDDVRIKIFNSYLNYL